MEECPAWRALCLVAAFFFSGCAAYHERMVEVEDALVEGQPDKALEALDRDAGDAGDPDHSLYLLNRAMLLHQKGDLEGTLQALQEAARLTQEAAVLSVSEQAAAATLNEGRRSYAGAPHERRLIHVLLALTYLELGRLEDARVEALQIDLVSRALAQQGEPEDPFARWLAGMVFEALGEWDQARVDYQKALEAYQNGKSPYALPVPRQLIRDLVRADRALGLEDEARRLRERFALAVDDPALDPGRYRRLGELIVVYLDNLAPLWLETTTLVQGPEGRLVRISLPYPVARPSPVEVAELQADGHRVPLEKAEDVAHLSVAWLDRQMPKLLARAVIRAVSKDQMARKAKQEDQILGVVVNLIGVVSERADTRSWTLLPDNFRVARLALPPGRYRVGLVLRGKDMGLTRLPLGEVVLQGGGKRFLTARWIDPHVLRWWDVPPDDQWMEVHVYE